MPDTYARVLRKNLTIAVRKLWGALRQLDKDGTHFRKQAPMGAYIVDFVCHKAKLIIEVDGGQHADSSHDKIRDAWLNSQGYCVLRFWNNEVLENLEGVTTVIAEALKKPHPHPFPTKGRGGTRGKVATNDSPPPAWLPLADKLPKEGGEGMGASSPGSASHG